MTKLVHPQTSAPKVTPAMIDAETRDEAFHVFPGTAVTICALTLQSGFVVTGEASCASPENFDAELDRDLAKFKARGKIAELLAYSLADDHHRAVQHRVGVIKVLRDGSAGHEDPLIKSVIAEAKA